MLQTQICSPPVAIPRERVIRALLGRLRQLRYTDGSVLALLCAIGGLDVAPFALEVAWSFAMSGPTGTDLAIRALTVVGDAAWIPHAAALLQRIAQGASATRTQRVGIADCLATMSLRATLIIDVLPDVVGGIFCILNRRWVDTGEVVQLSRCLAAIAPRGAELEWFPRAMEDLAGLGAREQDEELRIDVGHALLKVMRCNPGLAMSSDAQQLVSEFIAAKDHEEDE